MGHLVIEGGQVGQAAPAFIYPCWLGGSQSYMPLDGNTLIKTNLKRLLGGAPSFFTYVHLQMFGVSTGPNFHCLISFGVGREVISHPQTAALANKKKIK